jgi:hypothetical protein
VAEASDAEMKYKNEMFIVMNVHGRREYVNCTVMVMVVMIIRIWVSREWMQDYLLQQQQLF